MSEVPLYQLLLSEIVFLHPGAAVGGLWQEGNRGTSPIRKRPPP